MSNLPPLIAAQITDAIILIRRTPGYESIAQELAQLLADGKIRYLPGLGDRAHAGLLGTITLGDEPFAMGSALGLAETLVHERFHRHQNPLEKTVSFWGGVLTRNDPMARYEKPAYQAAHDFLVAYARAFPDDAGAANEERLAVAATFATAYGDTLA